MAVASLAAEPSPGALSFTLWGNPWGTSLGIISAGVVRNLKRDPAVAAPWQGREVAWSGEWHGTRWATSAHCARPIHCCLRSPRAFPGQSVRCGLLTILSVSPGTRLRLVDPDDSLQTLEISRQDPPNTISAEARGLRRGVYRLRWQVLASDGHITRGEIPFTLRGKNLTQGSLVPGPGLEPGYSAPKADVLPIRRSRINNLAGPRYLKLTHS